MSTGTIEEGAFEGSAYVVEGAWLVEIDGLFEDDNLVGGLAGTFDGAPERIELGVIDESCRGTGNTNDGMIDG